MAFRRITDESDAMLPPLHPAALSERRLAFERSKMAGAEPRSLKRKRDFDDPGEIRKFRRVRLLDSISRCKLYSLRNNDWFDEGTGHARLDRVEVISFPSLPCKVSCNCFFLSFCHFFSFTIISYLPPSFANPFGQ